MPNQRAFVVYPSTPNVIGQTIKCAIKLVENRNHFLKLTTWEQNDIAGRDLTAPIKAEIEESRLVIADMTRLNFNVTYEIGYTIGRGKRVFLIKNSSIRGDDDLIRKVGIFDTLGYECYEDDTKLSNLLSKNIDATPIAISTKLNRQAPIYVVETPVQDQIMGRIIGRVKKARLQYRSYAPSESIRLSAMEAILSVAQSFGIVSLLLSNEYRDSFIHNLRAAFVIGIAHGMEKPALLLQYGEEPVPLDVRDLVTQFSHPEDVDEHIHDLALEVTAALQKSEPLDFPAENVLASISIGDPMAENEFQTLGNYYLRTDGFHRALRGEVNLVVGRKGTGKTALFSQLRDELRKNKLNIVVDLKPEGYQLLKIKEDILDYLSEGAKAHLITAFWEYLLLIEVCYKILEKDKTRHLRDHTLTEKYNTLSDLYSSQEAVCQGDFSERLHNLADSVRGEYKAKGHESNQDRLTANEVTQLIHAQDLARISEALSDYLQHKDGVWIFFDNLDKGWSSHGIDSEDMLITRCLIDASRKIQRTMQKRGHEFHSIVFIRNDVYQLLMEESADFGKEMRASLDWSDEELLREMLRKRLVQDKQLPDTDFLSLWREIAVSHLDGVESSQYIIDRCLMRPRNLLKIVSHCKGSAVNLNNEKISESDFEKGLRAYSNDLLIEADQELRDIAPAAEGLIYQFEQEGQEFSHDDLEVLMDINEIPSDRVEEIIQFLLYYGFLGVKVGTKDPTFIYDVGYDMNLLSTVRKKHANAYVYFLNSAFMPALQITEA